MIELHIVSYIFHGSGPDNNENIVDALREHGISVDGQARVFRHDGKKIHGIEVSFEEGFQIAHSIVKSGNKDIFIFTIRGMTDSRPSLTWPREKNPHEVLAKSVQRGYGLPKNLASQ